jgi:hypothetical protein
VITLAPGAVFTGNFVLRRKSGNGWIVIRSGAADSMLPAPGTRITPAYAAHLPKILSPNAAPAIATEPGAHNATGSWRWKWGCAPTAPEGFSYGLMSFGTGGSEQTTLAQVPTDLVLDRSYVHGTATQNVKRCVSLDSANSAVIDSYLDDCHGRGQDTQAILGWNGPGPFKIVNNYLAGAGENVMFGGADPSIPTSSPPISRFATTTSSSRRPGRVFGLSRTSSKSECAPCSRGRQSLRRELDRWADGAGDRSQVGEPGWRLLVVRRRTHRVPQQPGSQLRRGARDQRPGDLQRRLCHSLNTVLVSNNLFELMTSASIRAGTGPCSSAEPAPTW